MTTPLIFGTVVDDDVNFEKKAGNYSKISNMTFDRKLRMMRADVYALLSVSTDANFFKEHHQPQIVKKSVLKFLEGEFNEKANELRIFQKLKGWNKLLNKKCNHNQIMQIHSVNQPYCVYNEDALAENTELGCNHYVYAHMLNPGYH